MNYRLYAESSVSIAIVLFVMLCYVSGPYGFIFGAFATFIGLTEIKGNSELCVFGHTLKLDSDNAHTRPIFFGIILLLAIPFIYSSEGMFVLLLFICTIRLHEYLADKIEDDTSDAGA